MAIISATTNCINATRCTLRVAPRERVVCVYALVSLRGRCVTVLEKGGGAITSKCEKRCVAYWWIHVNYAMHKREEHNISSFFLLH